ncbi:MAG TPA: hypothetical protein VKX17_06530 [Planctomycetota bacterium]|nr:hypothetical protein [Planctomycetota bacterium]
MSIRPSQVFKPRSRRGRILPLLVPAVLLAGGYAWTMRERFLPHEPDFGATARAERRTFVHTMRRTGMIQPLKEERIYTKLAGTILEIANEGELAQKDQVVLKLDPNAREDALAEEVEAAAEQAADYKRMHEESLKALNLAKEDVKSYELRLQLEQLRLDEIKKGPTPTDEVNAQMNLENNQILLKAKQEDQDAIEKLAKLGYASGEELRQKQTDTLEQHFKVLEMDIAHRKLNIVDPVKVGEQDLKVKEAVKTRNTAKEKVEVLQKNMKRDDDRYNLHKEREEERIAELRKALENTVYRAPCAGLVVPRKASYGYRFAPGREVYDGMEVLTIPDLSQMKVKLTVDEGHVSRISLNMAAQIVPAGWTGAPFKGAVIKISEQGRDEFEQFQDDTTAISGTANRKVFEVEVGLDSHSDVLRLGLRCDVEIELGRIENAIVVPRAALIRQKDGDVLVPIAGENGEAVRRKISVKAESELWAAVDGVNEGERIVLVENKPN